MTLNIVSILKNICIIFCVAVLISCKKNGNSLSSSVSPTWIEKGIQCSDEIVNSTKNLKSLPSNILDDISEYIDLEYGAPIYSDPIKQSEIKYVGEYEVCRKPIKIWEYTCGNDNKCYIGIQPWKNVYIKSTVSPEFLAN